MEEHKVTYMFRLFSRTKESTEEDIEKITYDCVQELLGNLTHARACYAPSLTNYEDFKLSKMMVIDGFFILELIYRFKYGIGEGDLVFDNNLGADFVKSTPSFLRNLIAYEQCYALSRHYVTSFAFLMDKLIDTKDDVSLLVNVEIIQSWGYFLHKF
ncbi:unnamed protein product [Lactuca saligna]|uniref:Uncharacterized protein n=1 Tax=Lactuca saligna TaxID=75948 RepID=A0AA35ZVU8_LACSI|nr:unnamed protein product [Lactuca saligna]